MKYTIIVLFFLTFSLSCGAASMDWEEAAQFIVELNGKLDVTIRVYQPTSYKPYMILRFAKANPLLLDLNSKKILELKKDAFTTGSDFQITTKDIPAGKAAGSYTMKNKATVFSYGGKTYTIKVRESLVGEVSEGIILAHSPDYKILRDQYKPDKKVIEQIKKYNKKTEIVVMFATWCPTCKKVLPRFLRVMDDANNSNFSFKFVGIAMGGSEPRALLERYGHDYPAFIFYQNGKEKNRIIGDPPVALEKTIISILNK
jgi:thiol-disulfide isomerase/thioredoxin